MNIAFRVDASLDLGSGHVMRCLTLAKKLRSLGSTCQFICREHKGNLIELIKNQGFEIHTFSSDESLHHKQTDLQYQQPYYLGSSWQSDAEETISVVKSRRIDWLIVDHYSISDSWEKLLRPYCKKLFVIDDLADRLHDCDLLLDQNLGRRCEDYIDLVSNGCKVLVGPNYALLRPEFSELRAQKNLQKDLTDIKNIFVCLGGVDKNNITSLVLEALRKVQLPDDVSISVVMGQHAPWFKDVKSLAEEMPWQTDVSKDVPNIGSFMAVADFAIGAAGISAWERCCLGLPSLVLILANNQRTGAKALEASGAALVESLGPKLKDRLVEKLSVLSEVPELQKMREASLEITDGQGASFISLELFDLLSGKFQVREAQISDKKLLFQWANDELTRKNSFQEAPIAWDTHCEWLSKRLNDPENHQIYIIEQFDNTPLGQVRFDRVDENNWEIDYSIAPEWRGLGLGQRLLSEALHAIKKSKAPVKVIGKVKLNNNKSVRIFESLSFSREHNDIAKVICYQKNLT